MSCYLDAPTWIYGHTRCLCFRAVQRYTGACDQHVMTCLQYSLPTSSSSSSYSPYTNPFSHSSPYTPHGAPKQYTGSEGPTGSRWLMRGPSLWLKILRRLSSLKPDKVYYTHMSYLSKNNEERRITYVCVGAYLSDTFRLNMSQI